MKIRLKIKVKFVVFFLGFLQFISYGYANENLRNEIKATIALDKTTFIEGEQFYITFKIKNISSKRMLLTNPSVKENSLKIIITYPDGKKTEGDMIYCGLGARKNVDLLPGKEKTFTIDFADSFAGIVAAGKYTMKLKYTDDYKTYVESNEIALTISPHPNKDEVTDYYNTFVTTSGKNAMSNARAFFKKYKGKNSIFENRVRIDLAQKIYYSKKNYSEVIKVLEPIIDKKNVRQNELISAFWYSGLAYYELGNKEKAIEMMERANTESAKMMIEEWTK